MGRYSTGAKQTSEILRIELSYLLKSNHIKKGYQIQSNLSWTSGDSISLLSKYNEVEKYLELDYTTTNNITGEVNHHKNIIQLTSIPSNLGKGEVIYFICPITGRKARVLYKCYGSEIWKSRYAYNTRIYYPLQLSSKHNKHNDRFWQLDKMLHKLVEVKHKSTYKGMQTKLSKRIAQLEAKIEKEDILRWKELPVSVLKDLARMGLTIEEYLGNYP